MSNDKKKIVVSKDGPYLVSGNIPLAKEKIIADKNGMPIKWAKGDKYPDQQTYALCRCGKSRNKPYCDGTHAKVSFNGTETASRKPYQEQAETYHGPDLDLTDAEALCAIAKFCHRAGSAWVLTETSDNPQAKQTAIQEAGDCPSGRLVAWEKNSQKPSEPDFEPSISVVEIPYAKVSGPLWAKSSIPIESADGTPYEVRNRVTLCRCGQSKNKPFCDGRHISAKFNDGDSSIA